MFGDRTLLDDFKEEYDLNVSFGDNNSGKTNGYGTIRNGTSTLARFLC